MHLLLLSKMSTKILPPQLKIAVDKRNWPSTRRISVKRQQKMVTQSQNSTTSSCLNLNPATSENSRPIAGFHPSKWGDVFLNYTPDDEATRGEKSKQIKELKEEVKKELVTIVEKPLELLSLVDAIQRRLGVAYHFEEELEGILQQMFDAYYCGQNHIFREDNLYYTSLRFRVLRQHGFYISCDIFNKFMDAKGNFKECLASDVQGLLSLYEASHVRIHGEDILDKALEFTTEHLKTLVIHLNDGFIKEMVSHALHQPLHKGMTRLESRYYISMYEQDPSHKRTLLRFAKLDFNFLLSMHKKELRDFARWWKGIRSSCYSFAKDRMAEAFFWILGLFYEPQYALCRKIARKMFMITTINDDLYDAYGVSEELELFTKAVHSWDKSSTIQLPDYMKYIYQLLLETFEEFEHDLATEGRSHVVYYTIEEMKLLCEACMQEARWRTSKYIPPYEEYLKVGVVSFGYNLALVLCFLGVGQIATREVFEWARQYPKSLLACGAIARLMNDMGGNKKLRDHIASAVECYMKQYGVSEEEAREQLNKQVENSWKDVNQGMLRPHPIPMPLLYMILQLTRTVDVVYKGEDGYTNVSQTIKDKIVMILGDSIPV